ncbi:MAG: CDP-archaeol synthase [Gammaproteobacteria bacterium]|jgi:CDP-2,3-bis-(O-geranylgeranyl)-sn-glycerol synthase
MDNVVAVFLTIVAANGAPILLRRLLGRRMMTPVDFGCRFMDGKPVFGASKTWVGIAGIFVAGIGSAMLLQLGLHAGFLVGAGVVLGDLFSSFVKRRLDMKVSSMAIFLDQIPESLFPYLLVMNLLNIPLLKIAIAVLTFTAFELLVSRFLFWLRIRQQPY